MQAKRSTLEQSVIELSPMLKVNIFLPKSVVEEIRVLKYVSTIVEGRKCGAPTWSSVNSTMYAPGTALVGLTELAWIAPVDATTAQPSSTVNHGVMVPNLVDVAKS